MENLTENNKLIAEFMEYEYNKDKDAFYIPNIGTLEPYFLKFHSSWDWLIPVVEKIQRLTIENALYDSYLKGIELTINLNKSFSEVSITKIYNRCVEFIKWYNQNKAV